MIFFPSNLRVLRNQHSATQKAVANQLGIKQRTYATYEEGRAEPSNDVLVAMGELFAISIESLVRCDLSLHTPQQQQDNLFQTRYSLADEKIKMIIKILLDI